MMLSHKAGSRLQATLYKIHICTVGLHQSQWRTSQMHTFNKPVHSQRGRAGNYVWILSITDQTAEQTQTMQVSRRRTHWRRPPPYSRCYDSHQPFNIATVLHETDSWIAGTLNMRRYYIARSRLVAQLMLKLRQCTVLTTPIYDKSS